MCHIAHPTPIWFSNDTFPHWAQHHHTKPATLSFTPILVIHSAQSSAPQLPSGSVSPVFASPGISSILSVNPTLLQYWSQPLQQASVPDPAPKSDTPFSVPVLAPLSHIYKCPVGAGSGCGVPGAYRRQCTVAVPSACACACVPCRGRVECIVQHIFMNKIVLNIFRALG